MKRFALLIALALFVGVALVATFSHQTSVRDAQVAGSIVSMAPNVTETIFALGLQSRLIGVSTACDYPPEAARIPKVADMGVPDVELLYALKPELVISVPLRDPEAEGAIRASGARFLAVQQDSIEEVLASIEKIGEAAGIPERAREYADSLRGRMAHATVNVPEDQRPRVYVELQPNPLATMAKGTFLDELIHRAGGRNIAHDFPKAWTTISPDDVVARNPQIIIVAHMATPDPRTALAQRIGWSGIDAIKSGWVITDLDANLFLRPGPRLVDGLEALAKLFERYRKEKAK